MLQQNRFQNIRSFKLAIAATLLAFLCSPLLGEKPRTLGIAKEKPANGPAIKIDGGYMVPYKVVIPGTDATFEMIPCPGGKFLMGSSDGEKDRKDHEGPQVEIAMEPFWMGKTEVTWKEYKLYMGLDATFKAFREFKMREVTEENEIDTITAPSTLYDPSFTFKAGKGDDQPAVTMTQYAAKQYTKWISGLTGEFYRLPTEAEWEYACRAGTTTAYSFGDDASKLGDYGWFKDNSEGRRHSVAQKKPNAWGLYDMHGGASEWVLDGLSDDYSAWKKEKQTAATALNWPDEVYPRVVRGGSWLRSAKYCRSASRVGSDDEDWKDEDPNYPLSPWWFTTKPATGVGMRMFRPLVAPKTVKERNHYWKEDHEEIVDDVISRLKDEGKGARGLVDPKLPDAIEELLEKQKASN